MKVHCTGTLALLTPAFKARAVSYRRAQVFATKHLPPDRRGGAADDPREDLGRDAARAIRSAVAPSGITDQRLLGGGGEGVESAERDAGCDGCVGQRSHRWAAELSSQVDPIKGRQDRLVRWMVDPGAQKEVASARCAQQQQRYVADRKAESEQLLREKGGSLTRGALGQPLDI